jgi:site-specific DNA-methyltransferase (adenine-specific)/modification methylase
MQTNLVHNESCLDTLVRLEDNSVDLVITSPPYNLRRRVSKGKLISRGNDTPKNVAKYTEFTDDLPTEEYLEFHSKVLTECLRVSNRVFYNIAVVAGSKQALFQMIGSFAESLKDVIIWDKGHGEPAVQEGVLNRQFEFILVFEKDYPISRMFRKDVYFNRGTLSDVWKIPREKHAEGHSAVMPTKLVRTILSNFSATGDVVYDPFMGAGTTAVVCEEMGRKWIGSEINPEYVEIALDRVDNVSTLNNFLI